eukprot:SAG31_NODE_22370_length_527_cov_0.862150_1_plen_58_part_10
MTEFATFNIKLRNIVAPYGGIITAADNRTAISFEDNLSNAGGAVLVNQDGHRFRILRP